MEGSAEEGAMYVRVLWGWEQTAEDTPMKSHRSSRAHTHHRRPRPRCAIGRQTTLLCPLRTNHHASPRPSTRSLSS